MTEVKRAFAVGDSVISMHSLVSPPREAWGVGLEIPSASRGRVVDARPYDYPKPYVVLFDVEEGGSVEIDVTEEEIGKITPLVLDPIDMPPMRVRTPDRHISRRGVYAPTPARPHRWCKLAHGVCMLLMSIMYVVALDRYLLGTLLVTVLGVIAVYYHHFRVHNTWRGIPEILRHDKPESDERLSVDPAFVRKCFPVDMLYALSLAGVLESYYVNLVSPSSLRGTVCVLVAGAAVILWAVKSYLHDRAVCIIPKFED